MKVKEFLKKKSVKATALFMLAGGIGLGGFTYQDHGDTSASAMVIQQSPVNEVKAAVSTVSAAQPMMLKYTELTNSTPKELKLDQHKITVYQIDKLTPKISAKDAAKAGLEAIKKDANQQDDKCDIIMYHIKVWDNNTSVGAWVGVAVMNKTNRYEFCVNDTTGSVISHRDYAAGTAKDEWKLTNGTKNITVIEASNLKAFTKINADQVQVADCNIVEGKEFGIYMRYNNEVQTASYEVKDGVLNISVKLTKTHNVNIGNSEMTIVVPKGTKLDSLIFNTNCGDIEIPAITVKKIDITSNCGDIEMDHTSYDSAIINTNCGDVELEGCKIANTDIRTNCGSVEMYDTNMKDTTIKANCGDIEFLNVVSNNLKIEGSSEVKAVGDFTGKNEVNSSLNDVVFKCTKKKSEYSYDAKAHMGEISIDNVRSKKTSVSVQEKSAKNTLSISDSMGFISIKFGVDPKNSGEITRIQPNDDGLFYDNSWNTRNCWSTNYTWNNNIPNNDWNYYQNWNNSWGDDWSEDWEDWDDEDWDDEDWDWGWNGYWN